MTIPEERTRAVLHTRLFLLKLLYTPSQGGFDRVPKEVRLAARRLLKHYPGSYDLDQAAKGAPNNFGPASKEFVP